MNNQISAQASRLVANCCIAYSSTILNGIYEKMIQKKASQKTIEQFVKISPIAWAHISFTGKYNFRKSDGHIDFEKIMTVLEENIKK